MLVISAAFFVAVTWVLGNLLPGITVKDPAAAVYELAAWSVGSWAALTLAWTATRVGLVWLAVGLIYGAVLKRLRRDELHLAA